MLPEAAVPIIFGESERLGDSGDEEVIAGEAFEAVDAELFALPDSALEHAFNARAKRAIKCI